MNKIHNLYFICEDSHITVGENKREKCSFQIIEMGFEKDKKKFKPVEKNTKECGKRLIETHEMPKELTFNKMWDFKAMHAFLIDQKVDANFLLALQKHMTYIDKEIKAIKEFIYEKT